jgi:hypothetical protein
MKHGIQQLTARDYHALPQLSASRLRDLAKSPAHLRHSLNNPLEQTDAMKIGEAVHCAVLEPDTFDMRFALAPQVDRRTTVGKAAWAQFLAFNEGKTALKPAEWEVCQSVAKAVAAHEKASILVDAAESVEMSILWQHATGVECKSRIDAYCPGINTIFDLKTTTDASPHSFSKSIFDWGYHRQGAFYIDACRAVGVEVSHYAIIAVEKEAPYALAVYRLLDESIELGRRENESLIKLYKDCVDADFWPGYPTEIQDIGLPTWAANRITEELRR